MDAGLDGTVLVGHADAELGVVGQSKQHMKTKDTVLLTRNHGHVCMRQERGNVVDYVRHGSLGGPCAGGYMAALVVLKVVPVALVSLCMRARVRACVRACVYVCVRADPGVHSLSCGLGPGHKDGIGKACIACLLQSSYPCALLCLGPGIPIAIALTQLTSWRLLCCSILIRLRASGQCP
eukprot:1162074-Pelagomonas_calceolata.AAC.6